MEHQIKEFTSPVLDKPLKSYKIVCPLHYFAFGGFKEILLKSGYELAHPQGIFFHRPGRDLIYAEGEGFHGHFTLNVLTTLDFQELESLFSQAFLEEYKNKYVLVEGTESMRIRDSLNGPSFDEI